MPVTNISAANSIQQTSMRQPANTKNATVQNTVSAVSTKTTEHKKSKTPYIAAGIAIAALAGAYVFRGKLGLGKSLVDKEAQELANLKKILDVKTRCADEFKRILNSPENTVFGEIRLGNMDKAAEFRALDKARPDYLHEAANMAEEAYKEAYKRAKPEEGKNILDKIFFRIDRESKTIPNIYAQMPKHEAESRAAMFAQSAFDLDKRTGMSVENFTQRILEFMEKASKYS